MRWTSEDEPSVAMVSTWVSPRVNRPEPWARGRTPTSTEIWRSSVRPRPSIRIPSSRASWRAIFLLMRLNRALADARLATGGLQRGALLSPPVRVARIDVGDAVAERGDATGQVVAEPDQQVGRRLGVGAGAMRLGELDAEEVRQRRQLVVLEVRIALAGDRQRVEVAALLEVRAVGERRLEEAEVEADRVTDDRSSHR